jgi:hypothetical protein
MDDLTAMVAELEKRATKLEDEAERLRQAAALLRGDAPRAQAVTPTRRVVRRRSPSGTMSMAYAVLQSATEPLSPPALAAKMIQAGWQTDSDNPSNTLRTALRRMVERPGSDVHVKAGKYYLAR